MPGRSGLDAPFKKGFSPEFRGNKRKRLLDLGPMEKPEVGKGKK
jgi:hypothetical protein